MATHFNAFISYRHSPLDSRIAQQIHRQLERFKIPKAIQKLTGIKKIDRIFRDKEELPLSVNLSDDINEALIHSDFLIVICSPRFQQSQWCMREIDLFLQTHPVERILIVLAEGEPDDVVPPILTQNREPLCCDYRMKPRKAKQIELPRLVSALLGCRYDELRQRQRQYRMRRMVALFSAALAASLCLTAYFINTSIQIQKANEDLSAANEQIKQANVQIQDNLDQALLNQSQYLTSASQARLEAGDRLTAIALALEALPGENNDRPYVPEAELALNQALGAYRAEYTISAQGTFDAGALVKNYMVTEDGTALYIVDTRGVVTVWDTASFEKKSTIDLSSHTLSAMTLTNNGNAIFTTNDLDKVVLCFDQTGKELWRQTYGKDTAFLDERGTLLLLQHDYNQICRILFLNPDTGEEVRPAFQLASVGENLTVTSFLQLDNSLEQRIPLKYMDGLVYHIYLADPLTGSLDKLLELDSSMAGGNYSIECLGMDEKGNIILMRGDGSGMYNGSFASAEVTSPDRADILCYDRDSFKLLWQSEITTYIYSSSSTIKAIPGTQNLLIQNGNTLQIHDGVTGAILSRCETAANPLTLEVEADKTWGILTNGSYFNFYYDSGECYATSFTSEVIDGAAARKGYFVHMPLGTAVTVYRSVRDESAAAFDYEGEIYPRKRFLSGDHLALTTLNGIYMMDARNHTMLWSKELGYGYDPLGFSQDGSRFFMWNRYDDQAVAFNTLSGGSAMIPVDMALEAGQAFQESNLFLQEDKLLFLMECEGAAYLRRVDLDTGKEELTLEIPALYTQEMNYSENVVLLACAGDYLWLQKDGDRVYVLDMGTGEAREVFSGLTSQPFLLVGAGKNELLMAVEHSLVLADADGSIRLTIDLGEQKGVSTCIYGSELLVLCDNGEMHRYDREGKLLSQTTLQIFNTFSSLAGSPLASPLEVFWCFTADGDLILNALGAGNIICCDTWQVKAYIPNISAYLKETDELITTSGGILHAFRRRTVREQMDEALEQLGSFRLTEEQRKYYGLS